MAEHLGRSEQGLGQGIDLRLQFSKEIVHVSA
jgi:hypothetical protein